MQNTAYSKLWYEAWKWFDQNTGIVLPVSGCSSACSVVLCSHMRAVSSAFGTTIRSLGLALTRALAKDITLSIQVSQACTCPCVFALCFSTTSANIRGVITRYYDYMSSFSLQGRLSFLESGTDLLWMAIVFLALSRCCTVASIRCFPYVPFLPSMQLFICACQEQQMYFCRFDLLLCSFAEELSLSPSRAAANSCISSVTIAFLTSISYIAFLTSFS